MNLKQLDKKNEQFIKTTQRGIKAVKRSTMFVAILSVLSPMQVGAQQTDNGARVLEEIVVSVRKREENLQETPLSIVAFGQDALEKYNATNLENLNGKLPNVFIGAGVGFGSNNANFTIRGLGADRNAINQEAASALYIDDAYISRSDGALLNVLDVERVEVLRGPQGTLFGRNATGGAIRYVTKKPTDVFEGSLEGASGSDDRVDVKAVVNVPITDSSALRLTAATLNQDGFMKNALGQDLGDINTDIIRGYFRWEASDTVEILASADYTASDTNGGANSLIANNPDALFAQLAAGSEGEFRDIANDVVNSTTRNSTLTRGFHDSQNYGGSLTLNWDINDSLSFKSVTTYREFDIKSQFDFDAASAVLLENQDVTRDAEMYSQELQLSGAAFDQRLDWVAGAFYYNEKANDRRLLAILGSEQAPGTRSTYRVNEPHEIESVAFFGQGTFSFTDRFSITAGLRWTRDEKELVASELFTDETPRTFLANDVNGNSGPLIIQGSDDWSAFNGRVSLEFQATEDIFLFGSFARGFRAGALNDRPLASLHEATRDDPSINYGITSVDPEEVDVFELGMRSDLFNGRLRLNATAFYQEVTDFQVARQLVGGVTIIETAAESEAYGLEVEMTWLATDNLTIDGNYGYLNTEITKVDPGVDLVEGDPLGSSPENKYTIGAEYFVDAFEGDLNFRVDYSWTDDYFSNPGQGFRFDLDSYGLLTANIKYTTPGEKWAVTVFGNNLNGEEYYTQAFSFLERPPFGFAQATPGRGREVGIKLLYNL